MPVMVSMLKITSRQLIAISSVGMPSMAILPPWLMLCSMSRNALALPDISSPTSNPRWPHTKPTRDPSRPWNDRPSMRTSTCTT